MKNFVCKLMLTLLFVRIGTIMLKTSGRKQTTNLRSLVMSQQSRASSRSTKMEVPNKQKYQDNAASSSRITAFPYVFLPLFRFIECPCLCELNFLFHFSQQNYEAPGDGTAVDLEKPLLANTWSSAFSFAKCHLEESVPYDPFSPYIMGGEQFPRFVR